ncbi:MAG: RNA polymerase sigma-70 factor [Bacteroidetes bacterium]|nr:RNA polymerase sigma-70 factor [Bacteroidota bacterium]
MEKLPLPEEQRLWHSIQHKADERAFRMLFEHYYRYLQVTAYRYLADDNRAKDMVQDAYAELWTRRKSLVIKEAPSAYLRQMVVNRCLNLIKRNQLMENRSQEELENGISSNPIPDREMESKEGVARLQAAINSLPPRCRTIFVLSRFENLSHKEISKKLEISTKTIENQITRALKKLSNSLKAFSTWLL